MTKPNKLSKEEEIIHNTAYEWCCACDYDIAKLEERIQEAKEEARREMVEEIVKLEKLPFYSRLCQNQNRLDYCGTCEQAWDLCSCSARNTGYKKALDTVLSIITSKK